MGQRAVLSSHTKCMSDINAKLYGLIMVPEQLTVSDSIRELNTDPGGQLTPDQYQVPLAASTNAGLTTLPLNSVNISLLKTALLQPV